MALEALRRAPAPQKARRAPAMILLSGVFAFSALARATDPNSAFAVELPRLASVSESSGESAAGSGLEGLEGGGVGRSDLAALLASLRERETQLDEREDRLAKKARVIEAAEARLREQMDRLVTAEAKLSKLLQIADGAADKDIGKLVAAFQAMGGKRAAPIFENMDIDFAAGLIARMEDAAAADILGILSPEKAYAVTVRIAGRNARAPTE